MHTLTPAMHLEGSQRQRAWLWASRKEHNFAKTYRSWAGEVCLIGRGARSSRGRNLCQANTLKLRNSNCSNYKDWHLSDRTQLCAVTGLLPIGQVGGKWQRLCSASLA